MGREIERKFLVCNNSYRLNSEAVFYKQAYFRSTSDYSIRIRIIGEKGFINIKGSVSGATRLEYEYQIPLEDAQLMIIDFCDNSIIEKYRYRISHDGFIWEVDEFIGANSGLVIAEIELTDEKQHFSLPDWVGDEVTGNPKYYNSNLVKFPFSNWNSMNLFNG